MELLLNEAIANVYEAALMPERWCNAVSKWSGAVGGHYGQVLFWNTAENRPVFSAVAGEIDPVAEQLYLAHYSQIDERLKRVQAAAPCVPISDAELFGPAEVARMEIYQDFLIPFDARYCLATSLQATGPVIGMASVFHREARGGFDERDKRTLATIAFHIQRAVSLQSRLGSQIVGTVLSAAAWQKSPSLLMIVNSQRRVLFANLASEAALRGDLGLRVRQGILAADDPRSEDELVAAVTLATVGGRQAPLSSTALIIRRFDAPSLRVLVAPLSAHLCPVPTGEQASAIVLITRGHMDRSSIGRHLAQWFGLTEAEARLAVDLSTGASLDEIAGNRRLKISTLRSQLKAVLGKTDTTRQAELVALISRLPRIRSTF